MAHPPETVWRVRIRKSRWWIFGAEAMRVSDNERRRLPVIARGPLVDDARDRGSDMSFTCAGVDQESLLATKEKIQEGLLIIDAAVFPQNVEVGIVGVNLHSGASPHVGPPVRQAFGSSPVRTPPPSGSEACAQ